MLDADRQISGERRYVHVIQLGGSAVQPRPNLQIKATLHAIPGNSLGILATQLFNPDVHLAVSIFLGPPHFSVFSVYGAQPLHVSHTSFFSTLLSRLHSLFPKQATTRC